jgi:predicted nucleic acid-binding protein
VDRGGAALSWGFVVDASMGVSWVCEDQATLESDALLNQVTSGVPVVVPSFWFLEMANVLLILQRRGKLTAAQKKFALEKLAAMQFTVDDEAASNAFGQINDLAERHRLTVYGATYLELALRRKLSFASRDQALKAAGKRCGLKLL